MGGRPPEDAATDRLRLFFRPPAPAPSINQLKGKHWSQVYKAMRPWKEAAQWAWNLCSPAEKRLVRCTPCDVQVTLPFRTVRGRDPHNYVDTVVKAIVDGLKDDYETIGGRRVATFQGAWPDDTPEWVRVLEPFCVTSQSDVTVDLIFR